MNWVSRFRVFVLNLECREGFGDEIDLYNGRVRKYAPHNILTMDPGKNHLHSWQSYKYASLLDPRTTGHLSGDAWCREPHKEPMPLDSRISSHRSRMCDRGTQEGTEWEITGLFTPAPAHPTSDRLSWAKWIFSLGAGTQKEEGHMWKSSCFPLWRIISWPGEVSRCKYKLII